MQIEKLIVQALIHSKDSVVSRFVLDYSDIDPEKEYPPRPTLLFSQAKGSLEWARKAKYDLVFLPHGAKYDLVFYFSYIPYAQYSVNFIPYYPSCAKTEITYSEEVDSFPLVVLYKDKQPVVRMRLDQRKVEWIDPSITLTIPEKLSAEEAKDYLQQRFEDVVYKDLGRLYVVYPTGLRRLLLADNSDPEVYLYKVKDIQWDLTPKMFVQAAFQLEPLGSAPPLRRVLVPHSRVEDFGVGDTISVSRKGKSRPVLGDLKAKASSARFSSLNRCPACKAVVAVVRGRLRCDNPKCEVRKHCFASRFFSSVGLYNRGFKNVDTRAASDFYEDTPARLLFLEDDELKTIPQFNLEDRRRAFKLPLPFYISALGFPGVGIYLAAKIATHLDDFSGVLDERFIEAAYRAFPASWKMRERLNDFRRHQQNPLVRDTVSYLVSKGVNPTRYVAPQTALRNAVVCLMGKQVNGIPQNWVAIMLICMGATVYRNIVPGADFVLDLEERQF
ncbi:MAG: hypothetical protein DRJ64_10430, partial [Thermoprotei archaeon]